MKTHLAAITTVAILCAIAGAQDSVQPLGATRGAPGNAAAATPNADQAAYYTTLNRRFIEASAQFDLLNQLVQEHRKRADNASGGQPGKSEWESALAKELSEKASALASSMDETGKERAAFEQTNPAFVASLVPNSPVGATNGPSLDELSFLGKLESTKAALQQELASAMETGNLYSAQLLTNTGSYEFSRITSQIQDNGYVIKQLQRELTDLELRNLEFRALKRR